MPVYIVHYPAKVHEPKSIDLDLDYDFNFLTVAQWSPRKDIENTVRWFVEEFHDKEVGLVLKTTLAKNCLYDRRVVADRLKKLLESMTDFAICNIETIEKIGGGSTRCMIAEIFSYVE